MFPPSRASLLLPHPSYLSCPSRLSQSTELSSLYYAATSHQLSILPMVIYMFQCYSSSPTMSTSLFSVSVPLFLPCKQDHQCSYFYQHFHLQAPGQSIFQAAPKWTNHATYLEFFSLVPSLTEGPRLMLRYHLPLSTYKSFTSGFQHRLGCFKYLCLCSLSSFKVFWEKPSSSFKYTPFFRRPFQESPNLQSQFLPSLFFIYNFYLPLSSNILPLYVCPSI